MTTIVYKNNIIAIDSRFTAGGTICDDNANKIHKKNGVIFACCGPVSEYPEIIKAYFGEPYKEKSDVAAIVADKGRVYVVAIDPDDGFFKEDITDSYVCLGTGQKHAYTALDCGCHPVDAVKMAIKRDIYSGGRVRTYKVK